MGANSFSVTVEKLDGLGSHLADLASWFGAMSSLADTTRAQTAADSPLSAGALASFSETMKDALNATAKSLQEDRVKLEVVTRRYRAVDEQSAQSASDLSAGLNVESRLPTLSARQSIATRAILEGLTGLDDAVVPIARAVTGASDRVQESLRSTATGIERSANDAADLIERRDRLAGMGIRVAGAATAEVVRSVDGALEAAEDVVRSTAAWAEDISARADRVVIKPIGTPRR
jgi:hypothetical protein